MPVICMNCKKPMKPVYKVQSFIAPDLVKWEGVNEEFACFSCSNCGTILVGEVWYLPETETPTSRQMEKADAIYNELHLPLPFPNRKNIHKYIVDNERLYFKAKTDARINKVNKND